MTVAFNKSTTSNRRQQSGRNVVTSSQNKVTPFQPKNSPAAILSPHKPSIGIENSSQTVKMLPTPQTTPLWLRSLLNLEKISSISAFSVIATALAIYGGTVYNQRLWAEEYRKLEGLQRQERQLNAANEVLKNQLAQQAENPNSGLVPQNPAGMIFLPPASPRSVSPAPIPANINSAKNKDKLRKTPLGY